MWRTCRLGAARRSSPPRRTGCRCARPPPAGARAVHERLRSHRGADRVRAPRSVRRSAAGVENQHETAVAEFGRARHASHLDQRIVERLDDDLALARDAVDQKADRRRAGADDDDVQARPRSDSIDRTAAPDAPPAARRRDASSIRCSRSRGSSRRRLRRLRAPPTCGTANTRSPTWTMSASVIASVSGSVMRNVVPCPGVGLEAQRAAEILDGVAHDRHADAAAADAIGFVARRESRRADDVEQDAGIERAVGRRRCPSSRARRADRRTSMPRPSSLISSITDSPTVEAASRIVPSGAFAGRDALLRRSRCRG